MRPLLLFSTYLAPELYHTYRYITQYVEERLHYSTALLVGETVDEFADGMVDAGFMCGLAYTRAVAQGLPVEVLVAPVLSGERYQQRPIYYSDVIVHRESLYTSLTDVQNAIWGYNETASHSGYNLVLYSLFRHGLFPQFLQRMVATGSHRASLLAVLDGRADVAAIDSHVLDVLRQNDRTLEARIRVLTSFGPSTVPPVVVSKLLRPELKERIRQVLVEMHHDPKALKELRKGRIERFVPISDGQYDDIRAMNRVVNETSYIFA